MLNIIKKIYSIISKKEQRMLYLLFLIVVVRAFLEVVGVASIMPFMSIVTDIKIIHNNKIMYGIYRYLNFANDKDFLIFAGGCVIAILVISNSFKAFSTWYMLRFNNLIKYSLSSRLLETYLHKQYPFFIERNSSDLGKNVLAETANLVQGLVGPSANVFASSLAALAILSLLIVVNPTLALISFAVLGGTYVIVYKLVQKFLTRIGEERFIDNKIKFKAVSESLLGIKDLKILGREHSYLKLYASHAKRQAKGNAAYGVIAQVPQFFMEAIAFSGIVLIVLYFLAKGSDVTQVIPTLALYALAGYRLMPALQQIFSGVASLQYNMVSLEVIHKDIMERETKIFSFNKAETQQTPNLPFQSSIALIDVAFRYPGTDENVLKNINIKIKKNTTVGFVGATGSGKTTTADIVLGLLRPTGGSLEVDGVVINDHHLRSWQKNIGYVPQQIFLCDDSIVKNIAFGISSEQIDMQAVKRAAEIANIGQFIEELPRKYETIIGDRGVRLSGGQRQRIGIARALYHDPSLLIMDEATSALDGITEDAVMQAINNLSRKKTIVLIAHRLTTVKDCDEIFLFENGEIVTFGGYDELMERSDKFRSMAKFNVQMSKAAG